MTCRHAFHKDCVDKWLQVGRNNCPACRTKVCLTSLSSHTAYSPSSSGCECLGRRASRVADCIVHLIAARPHLVSHLSSLWLRSSYKDNPPVASSCFDLSLSTPRTFVISRPRSPRSHLCCSRIASPCVAFLTLTADSPRRLLYWFLSPPRPLHRLRTHASPLKIAPSLLCTI